MRNFYWRHFRLFDNNGLLPRGGVTVLVEEFPNEDGYDIAVNTAVCSDKDHYNKRIGRQITWGRRRTEHEKVIPCQTRKDIKAAILTVALEALSSVKIKTRWDSFGLVHRYPAALDEHTLTEF